MTVSLYDVSVVPMDAGLKGLDGFLAKAWAEAKDKGFDETVLLGTRVVPNMLPLGRQVQLVSDFAKNGAARLAGVQAPAMPDEEKSFAELSERISKTRAFLQTLTQASFEGRETAEITFPAGPNATMTMAALPYITQFVLPNFHFHMTTAYGILRGAGLALGKRDYLGAV